MNKFGLVGLLGILLLFFVVGLSGFAGTFLQPTQSQSPQGPANSAAPSLVATAVPDQQVIHAVTTTIQPRWRLVSYNQRADGRGYEQVRIIWRPVLQATRQASVQEIDAEMYRVMRAVFNAGPIVSGVEMDAQVPWKDRPNHWIDQIVARVLLTRDAAAKVNWTSSSPASLVAKLTILQAPPN